MKINILKVIDLNKIDEGVAKYETQSSINVLNSYRILIMSEQTRDAIEEACYFKGLETGIPSAKDDRKGLVATYRGMHIAIDNSLEYGEIEIR